MSDDPLEGLEALEAGGYLVLAFLALGVIVFVGYEVYQLGGNASDALQKLLGYLGFDSGAPASATSAPSKNVPGGSGTIAGDVGGYDMIGNDGRNYSCNKANDCTPMTCDDQNNCVASGPAVPASTIGG